MAEYIRRDTVLCCIKESRENIDWGQSEDEDAFLHYSACLYRTIASAECLPAADVVERTQKNSVNLCDSCRYDFPECPSGADDVLYGNGIGNDNICCCNKYCADVVERKTGKWIYDSEPYPLGNPYGHYDCDQCGGSVPTKTNFCPNCGAKMEVHTDV